MVNETLVQYVLLSPNNVELMDGMLDMFAEAFDEVETYSGARPSTAYLQHLVKSDSFVALAPLFNGKVVGGIAAYELKKFEQERSEIYIYDLAVSEAIVAKALLLSSFWN